MLSHRCKFWTPARSLVLGQGLRCQHKTHMLVNLCCQLMGAKLCTYFAWFLRPSQLKTVPYFELPMPISRVRLLMQFRMGSHALPVKQGRLAKPAVPRHLRPCTLCGTRALGDERHFVFDCPHFAHIRRQFRSLYQDADGTMQCFVWHKDQKAVCHCLAAILNVADDSNKDASS